MNKMLLHSDVYLPIGVQVQVKKFLSKMTSYKLTKHVLQHAQTDFDRSHGYTLEKLEKSLKENLGKCFNVFEVELSKDEIVDRWYVSKVCVRFPYDERQDICISIRQYLDRQTNIIDSHCASIITAWLNSKYDSHTTLNKEKYFTKEMINALTNVKSTYQSRV